ncbi:molybdenum cofactor biosynthesis protein B [Sporosarcina sp. NCCP-2716]|uniref:MogA/MoaB family molybdenum cofactor biosynthesis protein n=1 Tax=Sporosarcina sp. NCCP-2716 TaxID=2943679 RepID=UPI00203C710E|nr:MogA/MoaB family molybdenum cofactor biosynthesis protein [Sporosarcina sp. NCCP-2716]GKV69041.1 molybdenum cofactor biosynthesis protein B [Sporosarcina sp. NCCP-2716]
MHKERTDDPRRLSVCVLTVSDTRTEEDDNSGRLIRETMEEAGHTIYSRQICPDDKNAILKAVESWVGKKTVDVIVITGGTGISYRDVTIETIRPFFTKELNGFGELFRYISYAEDVGSKALLSRAAAGAVGEKVLFALPGSVKAVRLALDRLVMPELMHIHDELTKHL